jgi:hypothetical protein
LDVGAGAVTAGASEPPPPHPGSNTPANPAQFAHIAIIMSRRIISTFRDRIIRSGIRLVVHARIGQLLPSPPAARSICSEFERKVDAYGMTATVRVFVSVRHSVGIRFFSHQD